jgi:hypothetical protein
MSGQECQDRNVRTGMPGQECQDRNARTEQPGKDNKESIAMGQAEQDRQNRKGRIG